MSSLMQFDGKIDKKGVHLEFYLVKKIETMYGWRTEKELEPVVCTVCGKEHPRLYTMVRKPRGMMGNWVIFRVDGEFVVPDLRVPMRLERMPYKAKRLTDIESSELWHRR